MYGNFQKHLQDQLNEIESNGLFKKERVIITPQGAAVKVSDGKEVIIFCANNYLGLSSHPKVIEGAKNALDTHGYGMSSVRFICGTQDIHKTLEKKIATFLGQEDTILYAAALDHTPRGVNPYKNGLQYAVLVGKLPVVLTVQR